jgi:predicted RNA-binding Zn-ribbon protein involved in translation (DUF1610 family)
MRLENLPTVARLQSHSSGRTDMSTTTSVTCPECGAVLRPAKPLRAGKSVKCPKCGAGFAVGGEEPQPPAAEKKTKPPSPVQKKPTSGLTPIASVASNDDDDDDGGGGTYTVQGGAQDEAAPVNYDLDTSIRDLRGPAMQELVVPSNYLILVGTTGFLGWVAFLVILLIPLLFPLQTKEEKAKQREAKETADRLKGLLAPKAGAAPKKEEEEDSLFLVGDLDLRAIGDLRWYLIIPCLLPMILGMIYAATLSMGAVKIQNLEGREWGVAASVMAMVPLNVGGLLCMLTLVLNLALGFVFEGAFKWIALVFFLIIAWGLNIAVGIWVLTVLNKPEVIAGFEYVAE